MESKTESAHFYSRAFRFATHYPVRFRFYPRLSSFVPLGVDFSCPVPRLREGFPKGRDRSPAPLCHEGAWGTGGVPHVSGEGLRGRDLCAKGPFPLPCSGSYHLREQGKWNVPLWEQREYPLWLLVPETGTALCGSSLYLLNFCFNSYNSPMASMGVRVSGWQRRMASSTSPSLMASSET